MKHLLLGLVVAFASTQVLAGGLPNKLKDDQCPVIGNKKTGLYSVVGRSHFKEMLDRDKEVSDNRKCFNAEEEAKGAGYKSADL